MAKRIQSDYLLDTGGIDLFIRPADRSIAGFWKTLEAQNMQHAICDIVYWEFLRQYDNNSNDQARQIFKKALSKSSLWNIPFDLRAADVAVNIYIGVKRYLKGDKKNNRIRMNELQCDIMIAAIAVRSSKTIVTDDLDDWTLLKNVIEDMNIGKLTLLTKEEMRDPRRWKGK